MCHIKTFNLHGTKVVVPKDESVSREKKKKNRFAKAKKKKKNTQPKTSKRKRRVPDNKYRVNTPSTHIQHRKTKLFIFSPFCDLEMDQCHENQYEPVKLNRCYHHEDFQKSLQKVNQHSMFDLADASVTLSWIKVRDTGMKL